jgi:hypothetical protein
MSADQDHADQIQQKGGPERCGIVHVSAQQQQYDTQWKAVFDEEIVEFHVDRSGLRKYNMLGDGY